MNVKVLEKRILRKIRNYSEYHGEQISAIDPDLVDCEEILGSYRGSNSNEPIVLVSTLGIRVFRDNNWELLYYVDIEKALMPGEKRNVTGINCIRKNGEPYWLPIDGFHDRFYDAFEFCRFIDRVIKLFD